MPNYIVDLDFTTPVVDAFSLDALIEPANPTVPVVVPEVASVVQFKSQPTGEFVDLLVTDDDVVLDGIGVPSQIDGRSSIAQDIKHMIRETGLLIELIGERSASKIAVNMNRIEIKIENDLRIKPGTARVTRTEIGTFYMTAKTVKYGDLEFYL